MYQQLIGHQVFTRTLVSARDTTRGTRAVTKTQASSAFPLPLGDLLQAFQHMLSCCVTLWFTCHIPNLLHAATCPAPVFANGATKDCNTNTLTGGMAGRYVLGTECEVDCTAPYYASTLKTTCAAGGTWTEARCTGEALAMIHRIPNRSTVQPASVIVPPWPCPLLVDSTH